MLKLLTHHQPAWSGHRKQSKLIIQVMPSSYSTNLSIFNCLPFNPNPRWCTQAMNVPHKRIKAIGGFNERKLWLWLQLEFSNSFWENRPSFCALEPSFSYCFSQFYRMRNRFTQNHYHSYLCYDEKCQSNISYPKKKWTLLCVNDLVLCKKLARISCDAVWLIDWRKNCTRCSQHSTNNNRNKRDLFIVHQIHSKPTNGVCFASFLLFSCFFFTLHTNSTRCEPNVELHISRRNQIHATQQKRVFPIECSIVIFEQSTHSFHSAPSFSLSLVRFLQFEIITIFDVYGTQRERVCINNRSMIGYQFDLRSIFLSVRLFSFFIPANSSEFIVFPRFQCACSRSNSLSHSVRVKSLNIIIIEQYQH